MTTIRVQDYLDDQDSDNLTASGAAFHERAARRHKIDNTVRIKNTEAFDKATRERGEDGKEARGE